MFRRYSSAERSENFPATRRNKNTSHIYFLKSFPNKIKKDFFEFLDARTPWHFEELNNFVNEANTTSYFEIVLKLIKHRIPA